MKGNLFGASKYMFAGATMTPLVKNSDFMKTIIQNNEKIENECNDMKHHMEEEARNLDKIFAEDGHMMDQQEMMEMMMKGKDKL